MRWRVQARIKLGGAQKVSGLGLPLRPCRDLMNSQENVAGAGLPVSQAGMAGKDREATPERPPLARLELDANEILGRDYIFLQSEVLRLLQELQLQRVELEMQNEQLRRAVEEAEEVKERYIDLYEFAPVGYFTVDSNTRIAKANLTGTLLLGEERAALLGRPFTHWIRQSEKVLFHNFLQSSFMGAMDDSLEITLVSSTAKVRSVLLKAGMGETDSAGGRLCRLTALDISLRKQAEQALENERELFAVFQSAPNIMILLDENLRVLKANRAALTAVMRDMDQSLGLRLGEMLRCVNATGENGGCGASPNCLSCFIRELEPGLSMPAEDWTCHRVELRLMLDSGPGPMEFFALISTSMLNIESRRLILVSIEDITERKKTEEALRAYQGRLEAMAAQLFVAQEGERRRIAADLHDGVVQRLGLCSQKLKLLRSGKADGVQPLDEVIAALDQAIVESRSLIGELSPPVLHILGLGPALEWLAQSFHERRDLEVALDLAPLPPGVERETRIFLYRSCAELLTNVVKHSQSRKSRIRLHLSENELCLSVEDAGQGFVHSLDAYSGRQGFGLFNISEMLRKWNGRLQVDQSSLGGAKVSMVLPIFACWPLRQPGEQ